MKLFRLRPVCSLALVLPIGLAALLPAGCNGVFVAKHKVLVDAISSPGVAKPSGKSYRLVAKRSVVTQTPVQIPVVKACVDAALAGQGMFEPPPTVPPELFIEVAYGRDAAPRVDPIARETYLQLSARTNPEGSLERATGPELWDVKVSVLGVAGAVESAMPLLSMVAANYVASDTRIETTVDVPHKSPAVEAVRQSAIQLLDARSQAARAAAAAAAGGTAAAAVPVAEAAPAAPKAPAVPVPIR